MSLQLRGLSARYGARTVLCEVSIEAAPGTLTAILGPNGSGKSTLLRAILGQAEGVEGSIFWNGSELRSLAARARAQLISIVPQSESPVFPFRVCDAVRMARYPHAAGFAESDEDIRVSDDALVAAGCAELADRPITELSGGELQRVWIARALAQATPIVLLDEPTAHLDARHLAEFVALVDRLKAEGKCLVAVFHDLNLALRTADQVLLLREGQTVSSGPPDRVLNPENLQNCYDAPFRWIEASPQSWVYPAL